MYSLSALFLGEAYWCVHSLIIKIILLVRGVHVGKNFRIRGTPYLNIRGRASNVFIGNNVFFGGNIDLRNRENGKIVIEDDVAIDDNCRLLSANNAVLKIGRNTAIGKDCIFNCGADLTIGKKCLFGSTIYINSSDHVISGKGFIKDSGYVHEPIVIEDGSFIGGLVSIKKGVKIKKGAVVGANSVVTHDLPEYSINVGVPAKTIKIRE
jgi:acetyltransferase-like isoleucine patch superfamily enzyme